MKSIRINAWEDNSKGSVCLVSEAKKLVPALPCAFTNYKLQGGDGLSCSVDVFPGTPGLALIPVNAPKWADEAVDRFFDDSGLLKKESE